MEPDLAWQQPRYEVDAFKSSLIDFHGPNVSSWWGDTYNAIQAADRLELTKIYGASRWENSSQVASSPVIGSTIRTDSAYASASVASITDMSSNTGEPSAHLVHLKEKDLPSPAKKARLHVDSNVETEFSFATFYKDQVEFSAQSTKTPFSASNLKLAQYRASTPELSVAELHDTREGRGSIVRYSRSKALYRMLLN
jgi:hypothetical protein